MTKTNKKIYLDTYSISVYHDYYSYERYTKTNKSSKQNI